MKILVFIKVVGTGYGRRVVGRTCDGETVIEDGGDGERLWVLGGKGGNGWWWRTWMTVDDGMGSTATGQMFFSVMNSKGCTVYSCHANTFLKI